MGELPFLWPACCPPLSSSGFPKRLLGLRPGERERGITSVPSSAECSAVLLSAAAAVSFPICTAVTSEKLRRPSGAELGVLVRGMPLPLMLEPCWARDRGRWVLRNELDDTALSEDEVRGRTISAELPFDV